MDHLGKNGIMNAENFDHFILLHGKQLIDSGVPKIFWKTLHEKLACLTFDAGKFFTLVKIHYEEGRLNHEPIWALQASQNIDHTDDQHIYLIDHMWTFRIQDCKKHLHTDSLRKRLCSVLEIEEKDSSDEISEIFNKIWRICNTYSIANAENVEDSLPVWYIMDEVGVAVTHSDYPNCRIVPFFDNLNRVSYSLMFPIRDIEAEDIISRDFAEGIKDKSDRKAVLFPWRPEHFDDTSIALPKPDSNYYLNGHIEESLPNLNLLKHITPKEKYTIYTEYSLINKFLSLDNFTIIDNIQEADILWYTHHFKNYLELSETPQKFVNQFPFEYVLTIKDLLNITCRKEDGSSPPWLPMTYNLKTEIRTFIAYYLKREEKNLENYWIVKPFNLARALDTHVTNNLDCIIRLSTTGPKIVQKYVTNPVVYDRPECGGKVKFDIRYVILLTNVNPLKAFVYKKFFLRFANKPFLLEDLEDYERHFTVMNYNENFDLKHILCDEFKDKWIELYPEYCWNEVEKNIMLMLNEVLKCATNKSPPCGIAENPQSRALYAADIILEWEKDSTGYPIIQPKILEINWMPDCKRACEYYPDFFNNVFKLMFLNEISDEFHEL